MFEQERRPVCVGVMCMLPCWSQACASSSSLWLVFTTGHDSKISSVILCLKSLNYVKDEIYLSYTSPLKAPVFLFSSFFLFFSACRMEAGSVIGHVVDDVVRHWGKIHWQGEYCSFDLVFFFFFSLCVCVTEKGHILMDWYVFPGLQWDVKIKKQISKADGGVFRSRRFVSSPLELNQLSKVVRKHWLHWRK